MVDDEGGKAEILRTQLATTEPGSDAVDPAEHGRTLHGIRGLLLDVRDVRAKFKYGGNVDDAHRSAVVQRLGERGGPGDVAAAAHLRRRTPAALGVGAASASSASTQRLVVALLLPRPLRAPEPGEQEDQRDEHDLAADRDPEVVAPLLG